MEIRVPHTHSYTLKFNFNTLYSWSKLFLTNKLDICGTICVSCLFISVWVFGPANACV